jgi:peroxiredoxin
MTREKDNDHYRDDRSNRKKLVALFMIIILFSSVIVLLFNTFDDSENDAPDFTLTDIDGNRFSLSDHRGKVVVLDIMATWCSPCNVEMGHLKDIFNNYTSDQVIIISIDIDTNETDEKIRAYKDEYGANWIFASDTDDVEEKYDAEYIPRIVIIDKEGKIAYAKTGIVTTEALIIEIEKLL